MHDLVILQGSNSTLVLQCTANESPALIYWGAAVREINDPDLFIRLTQPQLPHGSSASFAHASLSCELGTNYFGPAGLLAHRSGEDWAPLLRVVEHRPFAEDGVQGVELQCMDASSQLAVTYRVSMDRDTDLVCFSTTFTNSATPDKNASLTIDWASVACITAPAELTELISLSGRWAGEFDRHRHSLDQQGYISENRRGRTSQDNAPSLVLCEADSNEQRGACLGLHLGWSGNYRTRVDRLNDGRRIVQLGENFAPGELQLAGGATYTTPTLYGSYSVNGLSGMSQNFHDYYRTRLCDSRSKDRPRPVHYNTWEGIYFDHDAATLMELVKSAAAVGVERFVLDDGWFLGRRDDTSGLGDWLVDPDVYPQGLQPLIDAVQEQGMTFGLWVEPEMVNPKSELYVNHPDWVLAAPSAPQLNWRHQLVLDLTRTEVRDYLYARIDALLNNYDIAYLKWDMNRDITHPGSTTTSDGTQDPATNKPRVHEQTLALYQLIDDLRAAHPLVEIESCASGGARADFGILQRTDRIWTSDSNDAIDRQRIQRGASLFFPLAVLGAHVGPAKCHITGRRLSMGLRAATALFGHMGVEANLLEMSERDRDLLAGAIELYKQHRELLHGGDLHRLERSAAENCIAVVAKNKRQALVSHAELDTNWQTQVAPLRFVGLDPALSYRLKLVWPPTIDSAAARPQDPHGVYATEELISGELLMRVGIQPPLLRVQSGVVFELTAI